MRYTISDFEQKTFDLWEVTGTELVQRNKKTYVACRCRCGTCREVNILELLNGKSTNCGCVRRAKVTARNAKHFRTGTKLHNRWMGMIARCEDPNHKGYKNYGGRGIKVCERWRGSFVAFVEDMGEPPSSKYCIDRINNDGNYEPGNCHWTTNRTNCRNSRRAIHINYQGHNRALNELAEEHNLPPKTVYARIFKYGWNIETALTTPVIPFEEAGRRAQEKLRQTGRLFARFLPKERE